MFLMITPFQVAAFKMGDDTATNRSGDSGDGIFRRMNCFTAMRPWLLKLSSYTLVKWLKVLDTTMLAFYLRWRLSENYHCTLLCENQDLAVK